MKQIKELFIIGTCLLMWVVFVGAWSDTLNVSTPAYDDDPSEADDRMREIKAAFVERLDIDHYFQRSATSIYDATDTGKHRYITFREPNDLTSMSADESAIFSKDIDSVTELHWIDESDNVLQLTSAATINIVSADLLGTLANATYFTAVDAAGTGTVDLIKADANDDVVLPDGAELATSAAPTEDHDIANKKYVDDIVLVNGTATRVLTKYLTGTTDSDSSTSVAHSVTATNILSVDVWIYSSDTNYYPNDSVGGFTVKYNASYVVISSVGATLQGQNYRIRIDYTE